MSAFPPLLCLLPLAWQNQPPVHFERFADPTSFSDQASTIGFALIPPGTALDRPLGLYGASLRLGPDSYPIIWLDGEPRNFPPPSAAALCNMGVPDLVSDPRRAYKGDRGRYALAVRFEMPINRAGFELRRIDEGSLHVIVRCLAGGAEVGNLFYDVDQRYRFVGVESSQPFEELRIEFTNPDHAFFSLDNLVHELDLRDADRDGRPDFADVCPSASDASQVDGDGDGIGDSCDAFPADPDNDSDGDGIGGEADNCPQAFNPDQLDGDRDGLGDVCDAYLLGSDGDGDGIGDGTDNCPTSFNPEQADCDLDGIGDVCDPTLVDPATVSFRMQRGECVTLTKSLCLPPVPPVVDVLILFDTTGSMGGEIQNLRQGALTFIDNVRQALQLSDIRFGVAAFRDYPASYTTCGYAAQYSLPIDEPFEVVAPIGATNDEVVAAVNALEARGGQDIYEAYARALWEVTQPDSGIGFRHNSARFVLLIGDSAPHDCNLGLLLGGCVPRFSSGGDPGRDGLPGTPDDIDFQQDALASLVAARVNVLMIYTGLVAFCSWERWCAATGGLAVQGTPDGIVPLGTNLAQRLVELIHVSTVEEVTYAVENDCGLDIRFDPPLISGPIDVSLGAQVSFQETICVPADLPGDVQSLDCEVRLLADGVLMGVQQVHVDVGCTTHVLDFETEDDHATALLNGQALSSPPEFGRMVSISSAGFNLGPATFDSTPGGPNDPSINSDMLIGHGNLLLLQDSGRPRQTVPGYFDQVTDDPDGGDLILRFLAPIDPHSVLLADINPPPNLGASVTLFDEADRTRIYTVEPGWTGPYGDAGPHRLDLRTLLAQPGNGTPRWATALEMPGFQQTRVVKIVVHFTGYGAIDELTFCR